MFEDSGAAVDFSKFRVTNFRSINDSGDVNLAKITSLVGRNESGKSNLLLALSSLNPPGKRKALVPIKDFPRGRRLEECKPDTPVVWSWWRLSAAESSVISKIFPHAPKIEEVAVGRGYGANLWVHLDLKAPLLEGKKTSAAFRKLKPIITPRIEALEDCHKTNASTAWTTFDAATSEAEDKKAWAVTLKAASTALRTALGNAGVMLDAAQDELLAEIEAQADAVTGFDASLARAHDQVEKWLPTFVYISDFPELYGHQDLDAFTQRRGQDPSMKEREDNFEKLAKVADFDPAFLNTQRNYHETRSQILNRAGSLVTGEIRRLWKDRSLMVRFNLDGPHLDILVSDPNATYPIEINLDERSRGFRWFFAFYITFSADTKGGNAEGAVLLLDEPGLYLHAKSQENLLKHLQEDYKNQIIYTTHSPFMVPPDAIDIVRTVNIDPTSGTSVTNMPTGDARTLFPLQAALGYQLSQTLFVGHSNLIVEGVTDFWILSSVNAHFTANRQPSLPSELTITPAGGAGKVSYMAALLSSEELSVLVLLDDDRAGRDTQKDLVANKLLRDTSILFVTEGFDPKPSEADIEDLIEPSVYEDLVNHTYKAELSGKKLALNPKIPRIVKRYEEAFAAISLEFYKTRPAREFLNRMGSNPASVLTAPSIARFEVIFKKLSERYAKIKDRRPFS